MPKIKEVPSTEVHWQVANWNVRDAANARIKQTMGADAQYFAPVYVTHGSYYWSDPDVEGWTPLTVASEADQAEARALMGQIRERALRRMPARAAQINQVFNIPNDDFVFVRRRSGDHLEMRLTGWGFANYNRAHASVIMETVEPDRINEISVSFSIDGEVVPNRAFTYARGVDWAEATTDGNGYFSFGRQMPGAQVAVRDTATGIERVTVVEADTTNIDVDVTEYLTLRVVARHDGQPISGEDAEISYGRRSTRLTLQQGVAGCSLPWFEGVQCKVRFRDNIQKRELRKDLLNEFVFESKTPKVPKTKVVVRVTDNNEPVPGERITLRACGRVFNLVSGNDGSATYEYDYTSPDDITAQVRELTQTAQAREGTVEFEFKFDTPKPVEFDCYLRTVNNSDEPLPFYPVSIHLGNGTPAVECLTDANGLVGPIHVLSGNTMTAFDTNKPEYREDFLLDAACTEYLFRLPYNSESNLGDMSLRVVQGNGAPAADSTCILTQNNTRITAQLDANGMMFFGSDDFDYLSPVQVDLYSNMRTFPQLHLQLEKDEKQYELIEVAGPQPWWKIVGEIALAAGSVLTFAWLYFILEKLYSTIPNLFV